MFWRCQQTSCALPPLQNRCLHELMLHFACSKTAPVLPPPPPFSWRLAMFPLFLPSNIHRRHSTGSLSRGRVLETAVTSVFPPVCPDRLCPQTLSGSVYKCGFPPQLYLKEKKGERRRGFTYSSRYTGCSPFIVVGDMNIANKRPARVGNELVPFFHMKRACHSPPRART